MSARFCTLFSSLSLLFLLTENTALAWPPTYGSEFNFSNNKMEHARQARKKNKAKLGARWENPDEHEQAEATRFSEAVKTACHEDCTVTAHTGKFGATEYRVQHKNGYGFNIAVDPMYVEIQTEPQTLDQLRSTEDMAQKFIFDIADSIGLTKDDNAHFNIGIKSAFEDNPNAFLRFFSNYHNFPQLASGAIGVDFANAPPLSHLEQGQRNAFQDILDQANRRKFKDLESITQKIQIKVYTSTPAFDVGFHYQGISLKNAQHLSGSDKPFEFRAPRQPLNAHERTLLAEMFERRMEFERGVTDPIVYLDLPQNNNYSNHEIANSFRAYIEEMNGDWDHFKLLLPEEMREIQPDAFIKSALDWANLKQVRELQYHLPYVGSSEWTRKKFLDLLSDESSKNSGNGMKLIEEVQKLYEKSNNFYIRDSLRKFLERVKKIDHWSSISAPKAEVEYKELSCFRRLLSVFR